MAEYLVDEFVGQTSKQYTLEEQVDKKISLLYDLCILHKRRHTYDDREEAVRKLLMSYGNELQMDNAVHNVIIGDETLNSVLKRKGYL